MNRRLAQVKEQLNKIATYTQSNLLKHQYNGDPMDIETEQIPVYKQRRIPRCLLCKRRGFSTIMQTIHQKTKDRRNKTMKQNKLTICPQQGQIYRRKFYQGWELHEAIIEADNIRMKKIFEGTQGYILLQEKEEEEDGEVENEEYEIFEQLSTKQQNEYKNKYN